MKEKRIRLADYVEDPGILRKNCRIKTEYLQDGKIPWKQQGKMTGWGGDQKIKFVQIADTKNGFWRKTKLQRDYTREMAKNLDAFLGKSDFLVENYASV